MSNPENKPQSEKKIKTKFFSIFNTLPSKITVVVIFANVLTIVIFAPEFFKFMIDAFILVIIPPYIAGIILVISFIAIFLFLIIALPLLLAVKIEWWVIHYLFILCAGSIFLSVTVHDWSRTSISDRNFRMIEKEVSPDSNFCYLHYCIDTGALGYSRAWWAIIPYNHKHLDIADYHLPDGYKAVGWSDDSRLLVVKWTPYYSIVDTVVLETGDFFKEVKIILIADSIKVQNCLNSVFDFE